ADVADAVVVHTDDVAAGEIGDEPGHADDLRQIVRQEQRFNVLGRVRRPLLVVDEREQHVDPLRFDTGSDRRRFDRRRTGDDRVDWTDISRHGHTKLLDDAHGKYL